MFSLYTCHHFVVLHNVDGRINGYEEREKSEKGEKKVMEGGESGEIISEGSWCL